MNSKLLHKIIAVWCVFIAFLPMTVQLVHALENHAHDLCELENIQHFHKDQVDCEFNHFLFGSSATINESVAVVRSTYNYRSTPIFNSTNEKGIEIISLSTRGPPKFII